MSIFDRFKQQAGSVAQVANGVAQTAVKQTRTLAAVGRLKIAISSEEDKMKRAYTELGRLFYRDHEAQAEANMEDYLPWCQKVTEAKEEIQRLNQELAQVRAAEDGAAPEETQEDDFEVEITVQDPEPSAETEEAPETPAVAEEPEAAAPAEEKPVTQDYAVFQDTPTVGTLYVDTTNFEE